MNGKRLPLSDNGNRKSDKERPLAQAPDQPGPGGGDAPVMLHALCHSDLLGVGLCREDQIVWGNRRLAEIFGLPGPEALGGRHMTDFVHPDDAEPLWALLHPQGRGDGRAVGRLRGVRADGATIWLRGQASPVTYRAAACTMVQVLDITRRKKAEAALDFASREMDQLFNMVATAVAVIAADKTVLRINRAFEDMFGMEAAQVVGKKCDTIWLHQRCQSGRCPLESIRGGAPVAEYQTRRRRPRGEDLSLIVSAVPFQGPDGSFMGIVENFIDVTQLRRSQRQVAYQAYHDSLTGLPNRYLFDDRLTMALAHARRTGKGVAVLCLDLDHFKTINDSLGHPVGDMVLCEAARRLEAGLRTEDTAARFGGDEFMILLQSAADPETAGAVAGRLLEAVAKPMNIGGQELFITASIGVTMCPHDGDDNEKLMANADTAMYRAKEDGRCNYKLFTPAMNRRVVRRMAMENALRKAMEHEEFVVHYQPKVALDSGAITGLEALVRWMRPGQGLVPPGEFIPLAEENGMIVGIGQWVLRKACLAAKRWHDMGFEGLRVAVNLSPRQFNQNNLVEVVAEALGRAKLPADCLELEITENAVMHDVERAVETMRRLSAMGVHLSMDDFGRGYSSLYHLKRFPMDSLKIDRLFIRDALNSADEALLVNTIIAMSKSLKLEVVAEGVETKAQLDFLRANNCDQTQGFLFSKPLPDAELDCLLTSCGGRLDEHLVDRAAS